MKCLLFAAGLGTRLKPLTDRMPKAMVPVAGQPLLQIALDRLVEAGATEIVVNVHHFADQIKDYIATHDFPVPVIISDESDMLLDTGGGLKKAAGLFSERKEPILIHNVDVLSNADLPGFYSAGREREAALLVSERESSRYLLFDDDMRLRGWTNVKTGEVRSPYGDIDVSAFRRYAFSGIHLFSPSLLKDMEKFPERFLIMDFYLSRCAERDICGVVADDLRLLDVGKTDTLAQAADFLRCNA